MNALRAGHAVFLSYLRHECGLSPRTVEAYGRDLNRFLAWATDRRISRWKDLDIRRLGDYVGALTAEKLAPASVARHVASLKMFFRFLVLDGQLDVSAAELLSRPSLWERVPFVLSERQVSAFLDAPDSSDRLFLRDRALLETLYATGARASEVAGLKVRDVSLERGFLKCRGKGNKERLVPFSEAAAKSIEAYLTGFRPLLAERGPEREELFLTRAGRPMTRIDVWKLVKKYARRLGLAGKVSPHTLRHSFATHMLAQGADLRVIQELLGHAAITTTQLYTKVDASRLKSLHQRFHPRA